MCWWYVSELKYAITNICNLLLVSSKTRFTRTQTHSLSHTWRNQKKEARQKKNTVWAKQNWSKTEMLQTDRKMDDVAAEKSTLLMHHCVARMMNFIWSATLHTDTNPAVDENKRISNLRLCSLCVCCAVLCGLPPIDFCFKTIISCSYFLSFSTEESKKQLRVYRWCCCCRFCYCCFFVSLVLENGFRTSVTFVCTLVHCTKSTQYWFCSWKICRVN